MSSWLPLALIPLAMFGGCAAMMATMGKKIRLLVFLQCGGAVARNDGEEDREGRDREQRQREDAERGEAEPQCVRGLPEGALDSRAVAILQYADRPLLPRG